MSEELWGLANEAWLESEKVAEAVDKAFWTELSRKLGEVAGDLEKMEEEHTYAPREDK